MTTFRTGPRLVPVYEHHTATLEDLEQELRTRGPGFAQVSSPDEYQLVALPLVEALPARTFELVAHGADTELRWRRTGTDGGALVVVGDKEDDLAQECLEHSELLWGTASAATGTVVVLHSARIGSLHAPLTSPAAPGTNVSVDVRRYVSLDGHGNAYVADQRLLALRPTIVTTEEST
jgi:CRISPR-associated protein (TIGR03984 family)